MLFPYKDDNPRVLFPYVTYLIIVVNILIFLFQFHLIGSNPHSIKNIIYSFGFIPNQFNPFNIITSMFIHGGIGHLVGNMWFLYIFGDNIESILGHLRYFYFYLFCGIGAAVVQFLIEPTSTIPIVGASGAIAGILGSYMIKFPKARVHVFAVIIIFITTFIVPAQIVLGIWFIIQLSSGLSSLGIDTTGGVAWFAHIGGFMIGIGSLKFFQTFHFK
ncbi:MAG: rhomboid family intramembrane serine protease [Candidatus Neomarinimicrobiota bacterium]